MMNNVSKARIAGAAMVAAVALGCIVGSASAMAAETGAETGHDNDRAEVGALLGARTAPSDAIKAAEARGGGRLAGFNVETRGNALTYDIEIASQSGSKSYTVDAATGALTETPAGQDATDAD